VETYAVDGTSLAAVGGILGALTGLITWLLRMLLRSKDQQIKKAQDETEHMEHDRDYWRDRTLRLMSDSSRDSSRL
jgi:hypothetical protein